jgi:hypothetical protein
LAQFCLLEAWLMSKIFPLLLKELVPYAFMCVFVIVS